MEQIQVVCEYRGLKLLTNGFFYFLQLPCDKIMRDEDNKIIIYLTEHLAIKQFDELVEKINDDFSI